jgi:tetratricopeptide (TPR) repeat protein
MTALTSLGEAACYIRLELPGRARTMRILLLLLGLFASTASVQLAWAQEPSYDQFVTEALRAYEAGRFAEARTLFRRAHELSPTARTYRTIGMCSFNLGDYVDALQNLEAALTDPRKPLTQEQKAHVSGLIEGANGKLGRFRLKLTPENASLRIDGRAPLLLPRGELVLEPGRHMIEVTAAGYQSSQRELAVEAGDRATLELRLVASTEPAVPAGPTPIEAAPSPAPPQETAPASPPPAAAAAPVAAPARASQPDLSSSSTQAVLGYIGVGSGAAGIATFALSGGLALSKKSKLDSACHDSQCGPSYYSEIDTYNALRTTATVGLIAGAALLSVGIVLLLTDGTPAPQSAAITPEIGPGWAGVRGRL